MSHGRDTQTNVNIILWIAIGGAISMVLVMAAAGRTTTAQWVLLGIVLLMWPISLIVQRCKQCGYDVTKDIEGERHKGWPRVNETCANCGAEIP